MADEGVGAVGASKGSSPDMEEYEVVPQPAGNQSQQTRSVSVPRFTSSAAPYPSSRRCYDSDGAEELCAPFTFLRHIRVREKQRPRWYYDQKRNRLGNSLRENRTGADSITSELTDSLIRSDTGLTHILVQ